MGLPLATLAIFYLDKLYIGAETGRLAATGWTYFGVWALGLVYAFARRNDYATTREIIMLSGVLSIGICILNGLATGHWFFAHLGSDHTLSAWVDFTLLCAGIVTFFTGYFAPKKRVEKAKKRKTVTEPLMA